ncbi:uncharacterized protein IUM83_19556 [Phytophthora cinnamomi]|uniref:uncharacterized protein n=1 Tax=Phytophthora cinnamomi TaxID=4785 RepID=UPI00355A3A14|nr:hypothetical protein IUM83_19556 [Phytophthora cinnamomi]
MADAPGREVQDDTNERKLRPGEVVSLPESLLPSGNRKTKPATWIRADREGEAKQNAQNATLYVLNNHRFPKWLYSYDSSVTRTQREMTHHLVVYVCQVTGTRSQHGEIDAVVLARQESLGFSLVSYRRSGNNASDAGCDLPAIEGASGSTFDAVDDDMSDMISSTMNDTEIDSGSPELYETKPPHSTHQLQYQVFSTQPKQEEMRQRLFSGAFLGSYRHQHEAAANPTRQVLPGPSSQDRYVWQNATLYVLNNHRFPKWLYSYDSSVTRTQREMTHHLVVYVCQVTGTRSQHGEIDAVVLARQESPGFSLISYRRSGNNASDAGCDLPAIEGASGSTFDAVDDDMSDMISSTMNDMEIDSGSSELYETKPPHSTHQPQYQVFSTQPKQEEMRQRVFSGGFLGSYRHQHEAAANPIRQVLPGPSSQDRYLWQVGSSARTCGFLDKGQHLLILWRFIQRLSLRDLGFDADAVHKEARTFWLRAAAAQCGQ